jgi:eukaryotic-like serine/threonine-protein kinase
MDYADSEELAQRRIGSLVNGRWRIVRPIAAGGSAWLYVGVDEKGGPAAAIKVLHSRLLEHPEVVARFLREARVANTIGHTGVVRVLDEGRAPDRVPFLAMDLLEGENLEQRRLRKGGRLPVNEVMWATDQVLAVLAAAHRKGILHRDIKPENIYLTHRHEIKLLDFGIARILDQVSSSESTQSGTLMGTLEFMAPEQGRGEWNNVGVTTDLWAVGATMFTLLTGRAVHDEEDMYNQLHAVMSKPAPAMRAIAPEVPRSVQVLVDQALEFDATRRWSDAGSMQLALRMAHRAVGERQDRMVDSSVDSSASPSSELDSQGYGRIRRPPIYFAPSIPPMSRRGRS